MFSRLKIVLLVIVISLGGCSISTPLLDKPISLENKKWGVKILEAYEDKRIAFGNTIYTPSEGNRFFYVVVGIVNKTSKEIVIPLDKTVLSLGKKMATHPDWVLRNIKFDNGKAYPKTTFRPGVELERILVFVYPEKLMPDTLSIKNIGKLKLKLKKKKA